MKPEESVLHELDQLAERMHQLCVDNNIAFVECHSYETSRDETGRTMSRSLSVYMDEEKDVFDSVIAAAVEFTRLNHVPREAIFALKKLSEHHEKERKAISDAENVIH